MDKIEEQKRILMCFDYKRPESFTVCKSEHGMAAYKMSETKWCGKKGRHKNRR